VGIPVAETRAVGGDVARALLNCQRPLVASCTFGLEDVEHLFKFFFSLHNVPRDPTAAKELAEEMRSSSNQLWTKYQAGYAKMLRESNSNNKCDVVARLFPASIQNKFIPLAFLGRGVHGVILRVFSKERQRSEVLKISSVDPFSAFVSRHSELELAQTASHYGIGPDIYEGFTIDLDRRPYVEKPVRIEVTAMQEMRMGFIEAVSCLQGSLEKVFELCGLLNNFLRTVIQTRCMTHGDLHLGNVLLDRLDDAQVRFVVIDFSRATFDFAATDLDLYQLARGFFIGNHNWAFSRDILRQMIDIALLGFNLSRDLQEALALDPSEAEKRLGRLYIARSLAYRRDLEAVKEGRRPSSFPACG
jgi:hypothetical protein